MTKTYDSYKDCCAKAIGKIPSHWEIGNFRYSGIFTKGKLPASTNLDEKGMPIIGASEMLGKDCRIFSEDSNVPQCTNEDILILWDGANAGITSCNHVGIVSSTAVKYCCNNDNCNKKYLAYLFKAAEPFFKKKVNGTTIPHMNMKYINEVPLLMPSLDEQESIANFLNQKCDEIDSLISLQEEMISELQAYKQSVITEAVTKGLNPNVQMKDSCVEWIGEIPYNWNIQKLRTLGWCQNGISKSGDYFGEDYNYPFVNYTDAYKNYEIPYPEGRAKSTEEDRERYSIIQGDVLFTRTSETIEEIGFASTCTKTIPEVVFSGFLIRFRPTTNKLYYGFSKYYFRSEIHRAYFVKEMNLVTRASLSQDLLKNLPTILPPLAEQQSIASYLDEKTSQIDALIAIKQEKITELKDYKKSIIYEYVTGKKRV